MPARKNPTAVQIGQRIKQARKMAGFDTAAMLLKKIPEWGPGRLGNYEAGISLPSPDDIKAISKATGSSPCWIMFGLGPIRSTGRAIQAVRHQNFVYLYENARIDPGLITKFLKGLGISRKKANEYVANPFLTIPDRVARRCEQFENKPKGWMDEQHVEVDPVCGAFPESMRRVMEIFSNLHDDKRWMFLKMAEIFAADECDST